MKNFTMKNFAMNVLMIAIVLSVMVILTPITAKAATSYPYVVQNTFDAYSSSTGRRLTTRRNSAAYMNAVSRDLKSGVLFCSQEVRLKRSKYSYYTIKICQPIYWYIPTMRNGGMIYFYKTAPYNLHTITSKGRPGKTLLGSGRIWMTSRGSRFYNIVKIDSLGGGKYLKYTY